MLRKHFVVGTLISFALLAGCSLSPGEDEREIIEAQNPSSADVKEVAGKLEAPWAINKYDEIFVISQRTGQIAEVNAATGEKQVQQVILAKGLHQEGEGGFLGLVLTPDFKQTGRAFAYHTYKEANKVLNRVIVLRKETDRWVEQQALLEGIPGGRIHNGGRIKIGPDDKLYITAGDAAAPSSAQDLKALSGKILRMEQDGSIPEDNPFPNSYVYSYGHRNPQGLAWDEKGQLYSTEHGQSAHDEINRIKPGANYGWPDYQGDKEGPGMERPYFHTGTETWAPSGISYHDGKLYIATLAGRSVRSFDVETRKTEVI